MTESDRELCNALVETFTKALDQHLNSLNARLEGPIQALKTRLDRLELKVSWSVCGQKCSNHAINQSYANPQKVVSSSSLLPLACLVPDSW